MKKKPYLPVANFEQVLAYRPDNPATYTASPLVNAVADALFCTHLIEAKDLAAYLDVDPQRLAAALRLEMGMPTVDVIQQYRLLQAMDYIKAHPDENLNTVAHAIGYASDSSLWRFFERKLGITPRGKKSEAGPELWNEMKKAIVEKWKLEIKKD